MEWGAFNQYSKMFGAEPLREFTMTGSELRVNADYIHVAKCVIRSNMKKWNMSYNIFFPLL